MPARNGPVHVATTTRRHNDKTYHSHLLRRTFRQDGKVKHETLGNISHLPPHVIDLVRRALKGESLVNPEAAFSCLRSSPHGHVAAVLGSLKQLDLHSLIARPNSRLRNLVLAMIVARIVDPRSKLATARALTPESTVSTLGQMLNLGAVNENELYAAMDWLVRRQRGIEKRLAQRHLHDNTLMLYDLTSSYFEGHCCPLAQRGHSRDGKRGTLQIVFGLLCTADGCPIAVEVFEGSTSDPKTVAAQVDKIRHRFGLQRVVLVGDRGMLTGARIREDLMGHDGLRWITTLRAPTIRKLIKAGKVAQTMFDERDLAEISSPDFPGERLIVCRNPVLADQRHRKRQEMLAATEKELAPIVKATGRAKEPLRGAAAIGMRVGKVIDQRKMSKHFITEISDDSFSYRRDLEKIAAEEELDGLYIVRSNVEPELFDSEQTVMAYKDLAKVERAFRSMKTVDLKVRPIYHRTAQRVRAHVLLCLLAYYVEWHMRRKLAPVLFDDHDREAGERQRESIVHPAQRSPAARRKAASKRTEDDLPVHSFRSLMSELGTLTVNTMQVADGGSTFALPAQPTPVQQRCFELLGVSHRM